MKGGLSLNIIFIWCFDNNHIVFSLWKQYLMIHSLFFHADKSPQSNPELPDSLTMTQRSRKFHLVIHLNIILKQVVMLLCVSVRNWLHSSMSAEASVGSHAADSTDPQPACHNTDGHRNPNMLGSKYVKLNVGGSLHYTTVQTLSKEDSLLRNICTGGTDVTVDSEGQLSVCLLTSIKCFVCLKLWWRYLKY